jgi:hypothetical protein
MNGGIIEENEVSGSSGGSGGGVYVSGTSTFTMNGGTIGENMAADGGGVSVWGSIFEMNGGTIQKNISTGQNYGGGGVFLITGTFIMSGGTIQGNTSAGASGFGGGVFLRRTEDGDTFIKTGDAVIYGDTDTSHDNDTENTNVSTYGGHAVYSFGGKKRNADSPANHNLYAKYNGSSWSYDGTAEGISGLGDTEANWE